MGEMSELRGHGIYSVENEVQLWVGHKRNLFRFSFFSFFSCIFSSLFFSSSFLNALHDFKPFFTFFALLSFACASVVSILMRSSQDSDQL